MNSTLIIDRGDVASLVALAVQADCAQVILWHMEEPDAAAPRRRSMVENHGSIMGVRRIIQTSARDVGMPDMAPPTALFQAHVLLEAVILSRQLGCSRIVWPIQVGPDHERLGPVAMVADGVTHLADVVSRESAVADPDSPVGPPLIDMPLMDLTDQQLAEILADRGCPVATCWPCETGEETPCGQCGSCQRWTEAFRTGGVTWPWTGPAATSRHGARREPLGKSG